MSETEYNNLTKGTIVTQNGQYFIVCEQIEDGFIDTQELSDIGRLTEFGFQHTNINYKFAEVVDNQNVIDAINIWLDEEDDICEPYSFISGYCRRDVNLIYNTQVYQWLRANTSCGLGDAKSYLDSLIEIIQHHPVYRTDSKLKLTYEEV